MNNQHTRTSYTPQIKTNPIGQEPGHADDGGESLVSGRSREHHPEVPAAIEHPPHAPAETLTSERSVDDEIDEAGRESFPASDPPSFTGATASPSKKPKCHKYESKPMAVKHAAAPAFAETTEIAGKSVLITGGTTGIGRAAALMLATNGAHVFIFGRHGQELSDALHDLQAISDDAFGITADVATSEGIERVFDEVDKRFDRLDVLINNAGLAADSAVDGDYDNIEYIVKTNLVGYMACANEAVKRMKDAGGGHIINVGSMSADDRGKGSSLYVATKAGIQGFSEALGKEVNKDGIKVSLIEPGAVGTDMQPEPPKEQRKKEGRLEMLTAEDIAACIHYCLTQPKRCDVVEVRIRPHLQAL